jgi:hypothetical protein
VDICFPSETLFSPGQAYRLANYVCQHSYCIILTAGTAILVRSRIVNHTVRFPSMMNLELPPYTLCWPAEK